MSRAMQLKLKIATVNNSIRSRCKGYNYNFATMVLLVPIYGSLSSSLIRFSSMERIMNI